MERQSKMGLFVAATITGLFFAAGVTANVGAMRNVDVFRSGKVHEGRAIFVQVCAACHSSEPNKHKIGPSLFGVVGRPAGSASGFSYSDAMKEAVVTWNDETLDRYLADPKNFIRGGTMPYSLLMGTGSDERRKDVIAYLRTLQ